MRMLLAACLFAFFLLETTVLPWLMPPGWLDHFALRFVLVGVLFIGLFLNRYFALMLGMLFGLIIDVTQFVYMFGLYTAIYGLTGYFSGLLVKQRHALHFTPAIITIASALFVFELSLYVIYQFYDQTDIGLFSAFIRNIIPTVLINTGFAALIYRPAERLLLTMQTFERVEE